jgi:putative transposase
MGRRGDAFDNALAESFFATLETELIDRHTFRSRDEARLAVFSYIEGFYDPRRRHSTLGYQSPDRFEEQMIRKDTQAAVAVSS